MTPTIHTLLVHPGTFHADDAFTAAGFRLLVPGVKILRKEPTQEELDDPEIAVADVGGIYDPATNCFDHHQPVGSEGDRIPRPTHVNERPMAAFGLTWETYGEQIVAALAPTANAAEVAIRVKSALVLHIDAEDNGMRANTYSVSLLISRINSDPGTPEENFEAAYELAGQVLKREILAHARNIEREHLVVTAIENAKDGVIRFEEFIVWKRMASMAPNVYFAIYPSNRDGWVLECCPPPEEFMQQKLPIPRWAIENQTLRRNFGIIFAHANQFLVVCKTIQDAENLAAEILREASIELPQP